MEGSGRSSHAAAFSGSAVTGGIHYNCRLRKLSRARGLSYPVGEIIRIDENKNDNALLGTPIRDLNAKQAALSFATIQNAPGKVLPQECPRPQMWLARGQTLSLDHTSSFRLHESTLVPIRPESAAFSQTAD